MKFWFAQLFKQHKVLLDTAASLVVLFTLQYLKLIDIFSLLNPTAWRAECQPLIQALPVSIFFAVLGWWCFASCKDHERTADEVASGIAQSKEHDKYGSLRDWLRDRRADLGRICFAIAFLNLLRIFDHNQQPTLCAVAVLVINQVTQSRAIKLSASWIAKYSHDPLERITPGEYIYIHGTKLIGKVIRVGDTSVFVQRTFTDGNAGGVVSVPILSFADGQYEKGTPDQLRQAMKESA